MVKKQIIAKQTLIENKSNNLQRDILEKQKVKVNSKIKKKLKSTFKKFQINEDILLNSIKAIKLQNEDNNKKIKQKLFDNLKLYILLKNQNQNFSQNSSEDRDEEISQNLKKLKNKLIQLPCDLINKDNELKIALIIEDEKEKKIEDNFKLTEKEEENLEILTLNEFSELIKSIKSEKKNFTHTTSNSGNLPDLNKYYHMIIASDKLKNRINQLLDKSSSVDTIFFNSNKPQKSLKDFLENIISLSNKSSLLKVINKNSFMIKIANNSMKPTEIYKNVKITLFRLVSLILASMNRYTAVKAVVLKSDSVSDFSLPFQIYGKMDEEDLEIIEKN